MPCICNGGELVAWESEFQFLLDVPEGISSFAAAHLYIRQTIDRRHMHITRTGQTYFTYLTIVEFLQVDPSGAPILDIHWDHGDAIDCALLSVEDCELQLALVLKQDGSDAGPYLLGNYSRGEASSQSRSATRTASPGYPVDNASYGTDPKDCDILPIPCPPTNYSLDYLPWHCPLFPILAAAPMTPDGKKKRREPTPTPGPGGEEQVSSVSAHQPGSGDTSEEPGNAPGFG